MFQLDVNPIGQSGAEAVQRFVLGAAVSECPLESGDCRNEFFVADGPHHCVGHGGVRPLGEQFYIQVFFDLVESGSA